MCTTLLSDFKKPVKFKDFPLLVTRLDDLYQSEGVPNTPVTNDAAQAAPNVYVYEECSQKYPVHLYWLNLQGGWDSYVFNWKHEYSLDVSGSVTYVDSDFIPRYANRGDVVQVATIKTGLLPSADGMTDKERYEALFGIRYALQVYELKGSAWIPVTVADGSFPKYRVDDKFFELSFQIKYAPILIQKQ